MIFSDFDLCKQILSAVAEQGYDTPTPIQAATIPAVLAGGDVMASAQTGTGKTAAFVLPLLQRLHSQPRKNDRKVRVLIVTPTRELAAQVQQSIAVYGRHLSLRCLAVFGGVNINPQIKQLRSGVDLLVATPGRLLDLQNQGALNLGGVETLVLDEADRMLDMGFVHAIRQIQALLPKRKQTLLFSATFSPDIRRLARTMMENPAEIGVASNNATADTVEQFVYGVEKSRKAEVLTKLIREQQWSQVLIFSRTKHGADRLARILNKADIRAAVIHGNRSQPQRTRALADFKQCRVDVLVATDIAARGIDISELPHVVNYDLPHVPEDYVHRIGRTGRAGRPGAAVSLVCAEESAQLKAIERMIGRPLPRMDAGGREQSQVAEKRPEAPAKRSASRGQASRAARPKVSNVVLFGPGHRTGGAGESDAEVTATRASGRAARKSKKQSGGGGRLAGRG